MDNKMDNKKVLKIYGILFIILAMFNLVSLGLNFSGSESLTAIENIPANILNVLSGLIFSLIIIEILVELFLGIMGIQQSNGKYKGKIHITLAKIMLTLSVLYIVLMLPTFIAKEIEFSALIDEVTMSAVWFGYIDFAKKVLEEPVNE